MTQQKQTNSPIKPKPISNVPDFLHAVFPEKLLKMSNNTIYCYVKENEKKLFDPYRKLMGCILGQDPSYN